MPALSGREFIHAQKSLSLQTHARNARALSGLQSGFPDRARILQRGIVGQLSDFCFAHHSHRRHINSLYTNSHRINFSDHRHFRFWIAADYYAGEPRDLVECVCQV